MSIYRFSLFLHLILQKSLPPSPHPTSFLPHTNSLRHLLLQFAGVKATCPESHSCQRWCLHLKACGLVTEMTSYCHPQPAPSSSFCMLQLWYFGIVFSRYFGTLNWTRFDTPTIQLTLGPDQRNSTMVSRKPSWACVQKLRPLCADGICLSCPRLSEPIMFILFSIQSLGMVSFNGGEAGRG